MLLANYNPNTSGLVSLADRPNNERTTIQSQGGVASGQKRREIKRIAEIVNNIRADGEEDPVVRFIRHLMEQLSNENIKIGNAVKILAFLVTLEPTIAEQRPPLESRIEVIQELRRRLYGDDNEKPESQPTDKPA